MKWCYCLILITFFCITLGAQTQKADELFDNWEYYRAAKLYNEALVKSPALLTYFRLGECYRKMHMYREEVAAYDKVNAAGVFYNPEFYLYYGQALRSNDRHTEAKEAFNTYSILRSSDSRGNFFKEAIDIVHSDHQWDAAVTLTNVSSLNTPNADLCPVAYKDGITFTSNRKTPGRTKIYGWTGANYLDIYYGKKGADGLSFTDITPFGGNKVIKKFNDGPACFSKYFDTIYVSRVDKVLNGWTGTKPVSKKSMSIERVKIFISVMNGGNWSKAIPFPYNSDAYSVANPFLTIDGARLYFVSDMPDGYGETDIYYCNREGSSWGQPINLGPNVNTFNRESYPYVDIDSNLYFASDGYQGFGGLDICVALNNSGRSEKAKPLKYPFNSPQDDFGIMFLANGLSGYITSNRYAGSMGDDDIFSFDLTRDNVDTHLVTSLYTIGYRPPVHKIPIIKTPATAITSNIFLPREFCIFFDFDKYLIRPDAMAHLDSIVSYMRQYPDLTLLVSGNCDCRGTIDYNVNLAISRGVEAMQYLTDKGINADRMKAEGYGTNRKPVRCKEGKHYSFDTHQLERRASFHLE